VSRQRGAFFWRWGRAHTASQNSQNPLQVFLLHEINEKTLSLFAPFSVGGGNSCPPLHGFGPCRESTMHPTSTVARLVGFDAPYRPGLTGSSASGSSSTPRALLFWGAGCSFAFPNPSGPFPVVVESHRLSSYLIMRARCVHAKTRVIQSLDFQLKYTTSPGSSRNPGGAHSRQMTPHPSSRLI